MIPFESNYSEFRPESPGRRLPEFSIFYFNSRNSLTGLLFIIVLLFPPRTSGQTSFPGFPWVDSLPCVVNGQGNDLYITYGCFDSLFTNFTDPMGNVIWGNQMYSFVIDSIYNLPCGMSVAQGMGDTITPGQTQTLHLTGTASDSTGYYEVKMQISFRMLNIPVYTHQNVALSSLVPLSRRLVVRVVNPGGSCVPIADALKVYNLSCQ